MVRKLVNNMTFEQAIEHAKNNVKGRFAGVASAARLAGKVAIVTGSAQGFGLGIAKALYKAGAKVVIADLNEAAARQVADEMGERALSVAVDRRDDDATL